MMLHVFSIRPEIESLLLLIIQYNYATWLQFENDKEHFKYID